MTKVIVNRLEVIEIDHDAGEFRALLTRGVKQNFETLGKCAPVQTAGERIPGCQVRQFLVLLLHLGLGFFQAPYHGLQFDVVFFQPGNIVQGDQHPLRFIFRTQYRRCINRKLDDIARLRSQVKLRSDNRSTGIQNLEPWQFGAGLLPRNPIPFELGCPHTQQRYPIASYFFVESPVGQQYLLIFIDDYNPLGQGIERGIDSFGYNCGRVELPQRSEHECEVDKKADENEKHQQSEYRALDKSQDRITIEGLETQLDITPQFTASQQRHQHVR